MCSNSAQPLVTNLYFHFETIRSESENYKRIIKHQKNKITARYYSDVLGYITK
jgi:hypothetical protein